MKLSTFDLTRYLFLFTIAVLAVFGVGSLLRITVNPDQMFLYVFYAVAMFGDALAMLLCVWSLQKRMKFAFHISIFVLVINILPAIFDQFGLVDLLFVLFNIATLIVLFLTRKELLPA